jgi:syncollin
MKAILSMVVVASLLIPVAANAERGCSVFEHRDYEGAQWRMARDSFMQMGGSEPMGATGMIGYYVPRWNDKISSFTVRSHRGCKLTLFQHAGTWGYGQQLGPQSRSSSYVGRLWNDQASWVVCSCRGSPLH